MQGSKTKSERLFLLNSLDKILFNSNWSKDRFFIDFKKMNITKKLMFAINHHQVSKLILKKTKDNFFCW